MQHQRLEFQRTMRDQAASELIFLDESGITTEMTRRYGRAPGGLRVQEGTPGKWRTLTLLGAIGLQGWVAAMTVESPTDGDVFLAYLDQVLCPQLKPGQTVVMDNLAAHKVDGGGCKKDCVNAVLEKRKIRRTEMAIKKELIDELIASSEGSLIGPNGLVKELTKALVERMLAGELNHHLGYEKHEVAGYNSGNSRNGKSRKTLKGDAGEMEIEVPRDRNGTFEPQLIEKHQTRFSGFDDKILSMYALGMTTRDIQGHLQDLYGVDVSAALISEVTDSVLEEVKAWQERPLEALYPIVYLDALMVKMRQDGKVENRAVYTADWHQPGRAEVGAGVVGQRE